MKLSKSTIQISFSLSLVCWLFSSNLLAQKREKIKVFGDNCETIALKLDIAVSKFKEVGTKESFLIIIGNPVKNEISRYNKARISDAIKFFVKYQNIDRQKIVFGSAPSTDELGYLKFYINGQLIEVIKVSNRKARLCHGSGDPI